MLRTLTPVLLSALAAQDPAPAEAAPLGLDAPRVVQVAAEVPTTVPLRVEATGTYRIELHAPLWDAHLTLRDAATGETLAEDDDGGLNVHARITCALEAGRAYAVDAGLQEEVPGVATLTLHAGAAEPLEGDALLRAALADRRANLAWGLAQEDPERRLAGVTQLHEAGYQLREAALAHGDRALLEEARDVFVETRALYEEHGGTIEDHLFPADTFLADLAFRLGDFEEGVEVHRRAAALCLQIGDPLEAISVHRSAAHKLIRYAEDVAGAEEEITRARAIAAELEPRPEAGARAMIGVYLSVAYAHQLRGDPAAAAELAGEAIAEVRPELPAGDAELFTLMRFRSDWLAQSGQHAEALAQAEEFERHALAGHGPQHELAIAAAQKRGFLMQQAGRMADAERQFLRGLEWVRGREDDALVEQEARFLNNLAFVIGEQGRLAEARTYAEQAVALAQRILGPRNRDTLQYQGMLGGILHEMGDTQAAAAIFREVLAVLREILPPDDPQIGRALSNLAANLTGWSERELALLEEAAAILERSPAVQDRRLLLSNYGGMAILHGVQGRPEESLRWSRRGWDLGRNLLGPAHVDTLEVGATVAWSLSRLDRHEEALEIWQEVLPDLKLQRGGAHYRVAEALASYAEALEEVGDPRRALEASLETLQVRERANAHSLPGFTEAERVTAMAEHRVDVRRALARLARLRSAEEGAAEEFLAQTYDAVLAWKGRGLRSLMHGRDRLLESVTPEQEDLRAQLQEVQSALSSAIYAESGEISALLEERERIELALQLAVAEAEPDHAGFTDLRDALTPAEATLDFVAWHDHGGADAARQLGVWIVRAGDERPTLVTLGRLDAVQDAVEAWLQRQVGQRGGAGLGAAGGPSPEEAYEADRAALWDALWAPIAPHLEGVERIVVSPAASLGALPFEIVQAPDHRFLIERHAFVYLQDLASMPAGRAADAARAGASRHDLLAVGAVDFSERATGARGGTAAGARAEAPDGAPADALRGAMPRRWTPLPATAVEMDAVQALHAEAHPEAARSLLRGADATEGALKQALPRAGIAHLATHGFFQPEGLPSMWEEALDEHGRLEMRMSAEGADLIGRLPGLLSGLVCAGANRSAVGADDGYLTAEELSWLDLSGVHLVVLSACETGLGRPRAGEGMMGLRRALRGAGVETVISSLWSVRDEATAELMQDFYARLLLDGEDPATALRGAQLAMLKRNRIEFRDPQPVSWGAFVVSGVPPAP